MHITTTGPDLTESLRILQRLATNADNTITVQATDKGIFLHAYGDVSWAQVRLSGTAKGAGEFGISADTLKEAIKGHAELEMTYKNSVLLIKSGTYSAKLATSDSNLPELPVDKEGTVIKLDAQTVANLKSGVTAVQMKESSLLNQAIPLGIKLTEKGAFFACFDNQRMNFCQDKELKGDMEFTIPVSMFQTMLDTVGQGAFTIRMKGSTVEIKSSMVKANLGLPADDPNAITLDSVLEKAKVLSKMRGDMVQLPRETVLGFLANCRAVALKERSEISVNVEGGKATLAVKTYAGTIQRKFKVEGPDCSFLVDYEFFCSLFEGQSEESVGILVESGAFLLAKAKGGATRVVALNEEGEQNEETD